MRRPQLTIHAILALWVFLFSSACKKEYITEEYITNNHYDTTIVIQSVDIDSLVSAITNSILDSLGQNWGGNIEVLSASGESGTYNITAANTWTDASNRLLTIPLGSLSTGDQVIALTQVRLDRTNTGCNTTLSVRTGPLLAESAALTPGSGGTASMGAAVTNMELWEVEETRKYFNRIGSITTASDWPNAYVSLWANTQGGTCNSLPLAYGLEQLQVIVVRVGG